MLGDKLLSVHNFPSEATHEFLTVQLWKQFFFLICCLTCIPPNIEGYTSISPLKKSWTHLLPLLLCSFRIRICRRQLWFCTIRSQDCGGVDSRFILLQTASSPLGERFRYSGKTRLFWNILQKKVFVHIVTEIFAKPPVYLLKTQFYFHLYECCHK